MSTEKKNLPFDPDIADAMRPSREAMMAAETSVPGGAKAMEEPAAIDARKAMNAIQVVGAALHHVQEEKGEAQAQKFQETLDAAGALARRILLRWGVNPDDRNNRWMSNAIEKGILPHIKLIPTDDASVDALAAALAQRATENQSPSIEVYRQERAVDIAIFQGVADLMAAQLEFDFGRKKTHDEDLAQLRDMAVEAALGMMEILCPPLAPTPERATFLSICVAQAFRQMVDSWHHNAIKAKQVLGGLNKDQLAIWKRNNPNGFPLVPVETTFKQNMARLERLTLAARKTDRRKK